ncbi:TPA: hypothetical protein ACN61Y_004879, partial [Escherichia albertii]
ERTVFATTSVFNVPYRFSGIKKPAWRRAVKILLTSGTKRPSLDANLPQIREKSTTLSRYPF